MSEPVPEVTLNRPAGRPIVVRYQCPFLGKRVRVSTGTRDEVAAEEMRKEFEAKLRLGQDPTIKKAKGKTLGPLMYWDDFRERYFELQVSTLRPKTQRCIESELDIAERILKPQRLRDVADSEALHDLQAKLLAGAESRYNPPRPRSPHTVKSQMATVIAALKWAEYMEWLPFVPKLRKVKVSKLKHMKGRPITDAEFAKMLEVTEEVVGVDAAESWKYTLKGLWESALRLEELLSVSWDDANEIRPVWPKNGLPILALPHDKQKNDTEESIPLLPGFEKLLEETPDHLRYSWVFNPISLHGKVGREVKNVRLGAEWVGKVIGKIGAKAGVVVEPAKGQKPAKYASAHDLRRGCADRLVGQGVDERDVQAVLRHASAETTRRHYAPSNVQRSAAAIRKALATNEDTDRDTL